MPANGSRPSLPSRIPYRTRGTDHGKTSAHNRLMVWELLRQRGPQSRRQLSQLSHMGNSTLTYLVRDLFVLDLVRTKGKRDSDTVGKKQELIEINPDYGLYGGFFIEGGEVSATLIDAVGSELDHRRLHCGKGIGDALDAINGYLTDLPLAGSDARSPLQGIGLAIPGIVDCSEGRVLQCWRLGLSNYDLAAQARRRWDVPCVIENDVKLAAWSEAEHLAAELPDSLIFIAINVSDDEQGEAVYGMGMSVIQYGQLQIGEHSAAGELQNLRALFGDIELTQADIRVLRRPEATPNESLDRFVRILGSTIAILVDLVDPGLVVLGGSLEISNRLFLDRLERHIASARVHQCRERMRVRRSASGERGVANGAAMLARRGAIRNALTNLDKSVVRGRGAPAAV